MPELPEVETTRRGIEPRVVDQIIQKIIIRDSRLRWPIPSSLPDILPGLMFSRVQRRGKYLLFSTTRGTLIMHLGMSGNLRVVSASTPIQKHDHFDILFESNICLRFHDPRRFGSILWTEADPQQHRLLRGLGPEPFSSEFNADYLYNRSRLRKISVKQFIMDSKIVVGVGNIYANEALFVAHIRPTRAAGRISQIRYLKLASSIKQVLGAAVKLGGTTLRDFTDADGQPGYFSQHLNVYAREGKTCPRCKTNIKMIRQGQRATYYCPACQH